MDNTDRVSGISGAAASVWAIAGIGAAFFLSVAMDTIFLALRAESLRTFRSTPSFLFQAAMPIVLAGIMLAPAWLLFSKLRSARPAAIIFLAAGLLILGLHLSRFTSRPSIVIRLQSSLLSLSAGSSLYLVSMFSMVAGIVALVRGASADPDS